MVMPRLSIKSILKYGMVLVQFGLAILLFLALISPYVFPTEKSLIPICGLFFQMLFIANAFSVFIWLLMRSKWALLPSAFFLVSLPAFFNVFGTTLNGELKSKSNIINVASFNLQFSKPLVFQTKEDYPKMSSDFNQYLKDNDDIDIFMLQELGWRSTAHIDTAMHFPHRHTVENMTVGIFSKHPIIDKGFVNFNSNIANSCIWADIMIYGKDSVPQKPIRVYSFHLESNRETGKVPKRINQESPEKKTMKAMVGIVKHYNKFSIKRIEQVELIKKHALSSPYPCLFAGDLNDTSQSVVYKKMSAGLNDTFTEKGRGSGKTIESRLPLLRIDFIFVDKVMDVLSHVIDANPYSDHYMLRAQLTI